MKTKLLTQKKAMKLAKETAIVVAESYLEALETEKERLILITRKILIKFLDTKVYPKDLCVIEGYSSKKTKYYHKINENEVKSLLKILSKDLSSKDINEVIENTIIDSSSLIYIHKVSELLEIIQEIGIVTSFYLD